MKPLIQHKNDTLSIDLAAFVADRLEETYLTADSAAADTTLTVKDIDGFGVSDYLIVGELGTETCELVKVHASTAPSGTTITLITGGLEFAQSAGTKIYKVPYNQVEISHSATLTGAKSVLATQNIQVDGLKHIYRDTTQTSGYYFARYKDETGSTFSGYSDGIPYGGWAANTVGYIFEQSTRNNDVEIGDIVTRDDLFNYTNDCVRFIRGKLKRFPQYLKANYVAGQTTRGVYETALPTNIDDNDTLKSIKAARIGSESRPLTPVDPQIFEERMGDAVVTQVRTEASATDTTLEIDNSYDFDDSGTVTVYISGTQYDITYTGVTRSATAGVLTGIPSSGTGSISVTIPVDTNVWQNEEEGEPQVVSVRNGYLTYYPLPDASYDNKNIYLDYFISFTEVDSEGDEIDSQRFGLVLDYVTWRVRMKTKNNGMLDMQDGWYMQFKEKLNDYIRTTPLAFKNKMIPNINRIKYRGFGSGRVDLNNDGS